MSVMKIVVNSFALCSLMLSMQVFAEQSKTPLANNQKWKTECGSCHIAYPPKYLTKENWQKVMGGLDQHFGVNAVMDAQDNQEILKFLLQSAGSGERHSASSLRISDTPWFKREHREVSSKTWQNPLIKSRSNCTACHVNAEKGDWSERGIRMPGGLQHGDDD
jgi:nitrate/TMAO reductase-like tetraheme cytochrome c subunit